MKKPFLTILSVGSLSLIADKAYAATLSGSDLRNLFVTPFTGGGLLDWLGAIITWVIAVSGLIALVYLIMGGYNYLTAGGDPAKADKGRVTITNAIIGLVIIAISFALATFVRNQISSDSTPNPENVSDSE